MPKAQSAPEPAWMSQVEIRSLTKVDLPALEWEGEYQHFRRLYSEIYKSACKGKALMWVADLPTRLIIGQIFVQLISTRLELADGRERAYIYGFRVKPAYRGKGLGTRMLQVIEMELLRRKFRIVSLNVSRDNPAARRLYETLGYNLIGLDPGIWSYIDHHGVRQDVHEPAWRMEKVLNDREHPIDT